MAIHLEMEPCELRPNALASAVCPPALSQANKIAFLDMLKINAQIVNTVNAYTANAVPQTCSMAKRVESEPSGFWKRLDASGFHP